MLELLVEIGKTSPLYQTWGLPIFVWTAGMFAEVITIFVICFFSKFYQYKFINPCKKDRRQINIYKINF